LLNWNGWRHTAECLESVLRSDYATYQVVVCDNGSKDDSVDRLKAWAAGEVNVEVDTSNPLRHLTSPPIPKPVPYVECARSVAEAGGKETWRNLPLILVRNGAELGFAGGNNVAIRYALACGGFDYCWLLNNDTVVEPDALTHMVARMREELAAGMSGSTLLYYHHPTRIQSLGGSTFNKWMCTQRSVGEWQVFSPEVAARGRDRKLDFINGASLLVSTAFVRDVGLMSTKYFLYYEELDWSTRAKGRYTLVYAPRSIVYHKHGASIGTNRDRSKISETADYYNLLNRHVFTKTHYPYALPTVHLSLALALLDRIRRGHWHRVPMIFKVCWHHLRSIFAR
jgi:GT2 family glycosyltransferase